MSNYSLKAECVFNDAPDPYSAFRNILHFALIKNCRRRIETHQNFHVDKLY